MKDFKAFRIHSDNGRIVARFETLKLDDLGAGEVVIRVSHSGINYKDALAATGAGRILRRYPLVGGIDLAGSVESSSDARFRAGDAVLVTGCGLSETHDGGYAQVARVPGDWVIPMPPGLDAASAMAIGTAGFTAALAIHRMEQNGQEPAGGPIAVSGASGGVGSIAIDILGGEMLSWLTRSVDFWGNIASIGLAAAPELNTTVMPFILRGVALLGINSSATRRDWRLTVWKRIATDLKPRHLERIVTRTIGFDELPGAFPAYIDGRVTGRTVVRIAESS